MAMAGHVMGRPNENNLGTLSLGPPKCGPKVSFAQSRKIARALRWIAGLLRCNQYVDAPLPRKFCGCGNYSPSTHESSGRKRKGKFDETKKQGPSGGMSAQRYPDQQLAGGGIPPRSAHRVCKSCG